MHLVGPFEEEGQGIYLLSIYLLLTTYLVGPLEEEARDGGLHDVDVVVEVSK